MARERSNRNENAQFGEDVCCTDASDTSGADARAGSLRLHFTSFNLLCGVLSIVRVDRLSRGLAAETASSDRRRDHAFQPEVCDVSSVE